MEQVFPQNILSFSPELPENRCTIYFITLVPRSLVKISDFAREWRPPSCLSVQHAVFSAQHAVFIKQAKSFLKKEILPFGHLMYWFLRPVHFP